MEGFAILLVCLVPLVLFGAGWASCYFLVVKYRIHFERQDEAGLPGRGSIREKGWQP